MLGAYRRQTGGGQPWWQLLSPLSVRVPLPVAVGVPLLLIVAAALARRPAPPAPTRVTCRASQPVQAVGHAERPGAPRRRAWPASSRSTEVMATVVTDVTETRR